MPIHGYPGNVITANPTAPTSSVATGVWTTEQQLLAVSQGNWPGYEYPISRSLRFNSADSAYLNRTPGSAGNRKTWTWSGWVKRSTVVNVGQNLFATSNGAGTNTGQLFFNDGILELNSYASSAYQWRLITTQVWRDLSAWYHIVVAVDTTQATSSNRIKMYVNGVQITAFTTSTYPSQNIDGTYNLNEPHYIGSQSTTAGYFPGYLAEVNFIDGQALEPSSFGLNDPETGVWSPKRYTGTYGTNGFYLNFSDNSGTTSTTLGKDYSGNGNNWTPNNFSVTAGAGNDSMVDSPTSYGTDTGAGGEVRGNYATWNRLQTSSSITLNNGNLDGTISGGFLIYSCAGTIEVTTSKWYYETVVTAGHSTAYPIVGVCDLSQVTSGINTSFYSSTGSGDTTGIIAHATGTTVYLSNNTSTTDGVSYNKTTDVLMIAFDADLGKVWFGKNGTWNNSSNPATNTGGHTFSTVSGKGYRSYVQCNADTSNSWTSNFGQRPFAYTAPSGFKALCTQNLPTPTIGATSTTQANDYFNVVTFSGNGSAGSVTGVGFQPDFIWAKNRTNAYNHELWDAIRGVNSTLFSNSTAAEDTTANRLVSFNSDGFSYGTSSNLYVNATNSVAWNWKANGAGSSNTAGTITSTVSANTTSGFSIVSFAFPAVASKTVGHGLGVAPSMVIVKSRSNGTQQWITYHASSGNTGFLCLNKTDAFSTNSTVWDNTSPTSTVFTLGSGFTSGNFGANGIAYCFAPVAGYSAFGSYTGNGSTDGPFVYLGFRPRWIMVKVSSTSGYNWVIVDTTRNLYNPQDLNLYPNLSAAEDDYTSTYPFDILSNGFKPRANYGNMNLSGATVIYAAFAESPFKYALAR